VRRALTMTASFSCATALGVGLALAADAALASAPLVVDDLRFEPRPAQREHQEEAAERWVSDVPETSAVAPRSTWDSSPPVTSLRARSRPLSSSSFIVVHHSDFEGAPGPQAILDYHRTEAGFSDIGYHVVVAADGRVYEARRIDLVGAHAGISREQGRDKRNDPDEDTIGVVLDGDYEHELPPPAQLASAAAVIRDLRARYRIKAHQVIGHRDVKARVVEAKGHHLKGDGTVCPGDRAYDVLPALRLLSEP